MAYSFDQADAPERHETQYFEILGSRGIYHKGWTAVAPHNPPDADWPEREIADDVWELYDTTTDWSQAHDLAAEQPDRLAELQQLFLIEAARHNVLPLDDRAAERLDPDLAGRPVLAKGPRQRIYPGIGRLNAFSVLSIKNKSHRVTAEVDIGPDGCEGVIVAQGGFVGGWSIYAKGSRPMYCYNFYGVDLFHVEGTTEIGEGRHVVRMQFDYDGGGPARGGHVRLFVDDQPAGEGRVERTQPLPFSSDEPFEIGTDLGSPVTPDYSTHEFTGDVNWVEIEIPAEGPNDDGEVSDEDRLRASLTVE